MGGASLDQRNAGLLQPSCLCGVAGRKGGGMIDRSKIAQALAKAIAYKCCGKENEAREWARELVRLLEVADILN